MKGTVGTKVLKGKLDALQKVSSSVGGLALGRYMRLEIAGNALKMTAACLSHEASMEEPLHPVEDSADGATLVEARTLADVVRHLDPGDTVHLESIGDAELGIYQGQRVLKVGCLPVSEWEFFDKAPQAWIQTEGGTFCHALKIAEAAAKNEDAIEASLTGANILCEDLSVIITGCDGRFLCSRAIPLETEATRPGSIVFPVVAIADVGRIFGGVDKVSLSLSRDDTLLGIASERPGDRRAMTVRLLEAEYPNWQAVIKQTESICTDEVVVDCDELIKALALLKAVQTKLTYSCFLATAQDKLVLAVRNQNGSGKEVLSLIQSHRNNELGHLVNINFLLNTVVACAQFSDKLVIRYGAPLSPVTVRPLEAGALLTTLVMTMRPSNSNTYFAEVL